MLVRALICLSSLLLAVPAFAQADKREAANVIEVSLGGSTVVRVPDAGRVTLTDPAIADVSVAGGGLLVIGRKVGETNLILTGSGRAYTYLMKVTLPAQAIQNEVARLFPREDIEVRAVGGALVLVGSVSSAPTVTQVEQVALGYLTSPSIAALGVTPNVINLLEVKGRQQVQLEVTFAEVNRTSLREMGMNLVGMNDKGTVGAVLGTTPSGIPIQGAPTGINRATGFSEKEPAVASLFFGKADGKFPFGATLNLLAKRQLSKTLSQPTLVAMSGQRADFLAGGELPIQLPAAIGQPPSIEYKKFGIELNFQPTVLSDRSVQLDLMVKVSAPDRTIGEAGITGFKSRMTQTTVQLRDGQSFAISGLLEDKFANIVRKMPGLGDIPILGALFSSKEFEREETELVVVITVRLVDPQDADGVPPLPGETTVSDPTDLELFLLNIHEANGKRRPARMGDGQAALPSGRGPVGAVGFWR